MNIAFVAMSGIRVCDAKLLRVGLTLPGFVERSRTIASLPSLGLLTLAGRCKAAGIRTVIGGPHVTARPDEAALHCDAVVVGEGEALWPRVLEDAERAGRLLEPTNWKTCTLFDVNFRPLGMTVDELRGGFRRLAVDLYSEAATNARRDNFRKWLREHRLSGASRAHEVHPC
jgi:hypothetical protein